MRVTQLTHYRCPAGLTVYSSFTVYMYFAHTGYIYIRKLYIAHIRRPISYNADKDVGMQHRMFLPIISCTFHVLVLISHTVL